MSQRPAPVCWLSLAIYTTLLLQVFTGAGAGDGPGGWQVLLQGPSYTAGHCRSQVLQVSPRFPPYFWPEELQEEERAPIVSVAALWCFPCRVAETGGKVGIALYMVCIIYHIVYITVAATRGKVGITFYMLCIIYHITLLYYIILLYHNIYNIIYITVAETRGKVGSSLYMMCIIYYINLLYYIVLLYYNIYHIINIIVAETRGKVGITLYIMCIIYYITLVYSIILLYYNIYQLYISYWLKHGGRSESHYI